MRNITTMIAVTKGDQTVTRDIEVPEYEMFDLYNFKDLPTDEKHHLIDSLNLGERTRCRAYHRNLILSEKPK